ncbi:MAG: uracil-DNA glycosylase [Betaproteobacteria bacterium]|jgi:uracil-DNA glycosylase family 4|nr:MAG: uracil-DNA glycosylase [Betaproteobacteria bacterium]
MNLNADQTFSPDCRKCSRLVAFLATAGQKYPSYYSKPVPSFGVERPRLLIVGLAPGLHGANRTGRPFTGDYAGLLLYRTLYEYRFASAAQSTSSDDGLRLIDCRITNAVRCVPPQNKPILQEVKTCNAYLQQELAVLGAASVVLALGSVAHASVLRARELRPTGYPFRHGVQHALPGGLTLIDSYHCSRYNTQTKRLTEDMFRSVFELIRALIDADAVNEPPQPLA